MTRAARDRRLIGRTAGTREPQPVGLQRTLEAITVYDMYPEWGSAPHDAEHPARSTRPLAASRLTRRTQPVQEALDRRDSGPARDGDDRAGTSGRP